MKIIGAESCLGMELSTTFCFSPTVLARDNQMPTKTKPVACDRGPLMISNEGKLVDNDRGLVDSEGGLVDRLVDSEGGLVDSEGGLVDNDRGVVGSEGGLVDSDGGLVDSGGGLVDRDVGLVDRDRGLVDSDGGELVDNETGKHRQTKRVQWPTPLALFQRQRRLHFCDTGWNT